MISNKVKVELVLLMAFVGTCFLPTIVLGYVTPPDGGGGTGEIYASGYETIWGIKSGGSISDTCKIDGKNLRWTCRWTLYYDGDTLYYAFDGKVRLVFPPVKATDLTIKFNSGRDNADGDQSGEILIKYTDGSTTVLTDATFGYFNIPIDSSKYVYYVQIKYGELGAIMPGDRYIWLDKIAIDPV